VVPLQQVEAVAKAAGVQAVALDRPIPLPEPPSIPANGSAELPQPGAQAILPNPFLPTQDIGAPQFMSVHPTYDGRGVKIGVLDTGVDLLTPELQTAVGLDGVITRKVAEWVTTTDPLLGDDPTWVRMQPTQLPTPAGQFTVDGISYVAPSDGISPTNQARLGMFDERDPRLAGELGNDVNRDGNSNGSKGTFAVLWNKTTNTVWVDTNQNDSFADEKPLTDYRVRGDVGTFGADNPLTPVRESVPFVVQTDPINDMVNIGIVSSGHGTHVAGIAAGKGFLGGALSGAAPEAQVVSVRVCNFVGGCPLHAVLEGMLYAVQTAKVDVLNVSLGGLSALSDGSSPLALLADRLVGQFGVQVFAASGNSGPGSNTITSPADGGDRKSVV
jgi:subtilisin family serine protease